MAADLTIIILAFDEEEHIARCIESVRGIAKRIVVIDSLSKDRTVRIARELGADVFQNEWVNHSAQFNWALNHATITTQWVMRLDADEVATQSFCDSISSLLPGLPESVAGVTVNRRIYFLGKWIRYGGVYPAPMLRVLRRGRGKCENRWMDEHIVVEGRIVHAHGDICDINLKNLTWWSSKHNLYASREAVDLLQVEEFLKTPAHRANMNSQAKVKRLVKEKIYKKMPLGLRAFAYFLYRYFFMLGFLDGKAGLLFHFLQGFWYRFLVDAKVYEVECYMRKNRCKINHAIKEILGIQISPEHADRSRN